MWPPREKNIHLLQWQLKKGDVKCDKCESPATKQPNRLRKFFCETHLPLKAASDDDDDDDEGGIEGDERLDRWVRDTYGEEFDWAFIKYASGMEVVKRLPKFVVYDDDGRQKKGIAIVKRNND